MPVQAKPEKKRMPVQAKSDEETDAGQEKAGGRNI
jgi:hypothetical protein